VEVIMKKKDISKILGSQKAVPLETQNLDGPLKYLALIREVNTRIKSKVGSPSDSKKTRYHNIPLTDKVWKKLNQKAKMVPGKKTLSASQLAAFLIEHGLKDLEAEMKKYHLEDILSSTKS